VFSGVADGAVHLEGGPGGPARGIDAGHLGRGDVAGRGGGVLRQGDSRREQQRPGEFQRYLGQWPAPAVRQVCLPSSLIQQFGQQRLAAALGLTLTVSLQPAERKSA